MRSEDDFDGYLDMKSNDEAYTNKRRDGAVEGDEERTKKEDVLIGTNRSRYRVIFYLAVHWHSSQVHALAWRFSSCECHKL